MTKKRFKEVTIYAHQTGEVKVIVSNMPRKAKGKKK